MDFWVRAKAVVSSKAFGIAAAVLLCVAATATGVVVRRAVLGASRAALAGGGRAFTLESALTFRHICQVYREGHLPAHDDGVGHPEGVDAAADDTLAAAPFYAAAMRAWPGSLSPEERLRWITLLWWALSFPLLFVAVRAASRGSTAAATMAALLLAVSVAAVVRSTGQELSHENDAWPLWMGHAACWLAAATARRRGARVFLGWLGALALGGALCAWDLMRYYIAALAVWTAFRALLGRLPKDEAWGFHVPLAVVVVLVGALEPYHRAHHLLLSPMTALLVAIPLSTLVHSRPEAPHHAAAPSSGPRRRSLLLRMGILLALPAVACGVGYGLFHNAAYGHFLDLLVAKIRFLNVRPLEPALLTFSQRVLWTPALNSTSFALLSRWFPVALWLATGVAALAFWPRVARFLFAVPPAAVPGDLRTAGSLGTAAPQSVFQGPLTPTFLAAFHFVSLAATVLFFRFHIFLALTTSVLAGLALARLACPGPWRSVRALAVAVVFGMVLHVEAARTLTDAGQWGRSDLHVKETEALIEALQKDVTPDPVLANFGVSGSIAAYANCPVVLHPKFESPEIREATEAFWNALFKGDEDAFAAFMESKRALVYVHTMGQLANNGWELSPRYMVDALQPPEDAVVHLFEKGAIEELKRFSLVYENRRFRVYRLKPEPGRYDSAPMVLADARASLGFQALSAGDAEKALAYAVLALRAAPECAAAQGLMRQLQSGGLAELEPDADVMGGM